MRGVSGGACTCVQAFCPPSFVARAALFSRFYRIAVSGSSANCFLRESCTRERERELLPPPPPAPPRHDYVHFPRDYDASSLEEPSFRGLPPFIPLCPFPPPTSYEFSREWRVFGGEERSRSSRNGNCFEELFVIVRNGGMRDSMVMRRGESEFN